MLVSRRQIYSIILVLVVITSIVLANEASTLRYVPARITLNGKLLLESSLGDSGRVDADGVWDYLKSMRFKATEEFRKLNVAPDANEITLKSDATAGQLGTIVLNINYGGMVMERELKLVRVPIDENGREWELEDAEVDRLFDDRFIHRSFAASLENPKSTKR